MSVPESPIVSPAAWLGAEQRGSSNWIHVLTATEKTDLDTAIQAHRRRREPLSSVIKSDYPIPALAPVIGSWLRELDDGRGFILVRGFPVAEYSEEDAAFAYWLIGLHLGQPVPQNRKGELLGHAPDLIRVLFGNFYWDREADALAGEPPYFSFPICRFDQGRLGTLYIGWYIRNAQRFSEVPRLTGEQREALDLIDLIANDEAFYLDMNFERGDMQFLKNAVTLHARTAYEDWPEPECKRHLLRLWLTNFGFKDGNTQVRQGIRAEKTAQI
jgi:hypothetical protein